VRALAAKVARRHGGQRPHLRQLVETVLELDDLLAQHFEEEEAGLVVAVKVPVPDTPFIRASLQKMRDEHRVIAACLQRVRAVSDDYRVPEWGCGSVRTLMEALAGIEAELMHHIELEEQVLLPRFTAARS
jgi:regulator of cell morphogenesis and NO signaling